MKRMPSACAKRAKSVIGMPTSPKIVLRSFSFRASMTRWKPSVVAGVSCFAVSAAVAVCGWFSTSAITSLLLGWRCLVCDIQYSTHSISQVDLFGDAGVMQCDWVENAGATAGLPFFLLRCDEGRLSDAGEFAAKNWGERGLR